jgi:hypothetical protein
MKDSPKPKQEVDLEKAIRIGRMLLHEEENRKHRCFSVDTSDQWKERGIHQSFRSMLAKDS